MSLEATIARNTVAAFERMADAECPGDWSDVDAQRRYVSTLKTGKAWVQGRRSVVATVGGPDAGVWGYRAADALDAGSSDFDEVFATGLIEKISPTAYKLTW